MESIATRALKVSKSSKPNLVAGSIAGSIRSSKTVEIHAIGAGALNQALKSIAIARRFVADDGIDLVCIPSFEIFSIENQERTIIKLVVESR
jgi:stage V sporulation protein S